MPVKRGVDKFGSYYQWGSRKRYYYLPGDKKSREDAKRLANQQGKAIKINISK